MLQDNLWDQVRQLQLKEHRGLKLCKIELGICREARDKDPERYLAQHGEVVAEYRKFCDELSKKGEVARPRAVPQGPKRKLPPGKGLLRKTCPLCKEQLMSEFELSICRLCQVAFRKVEAEDIGTIILWAAAQARSADKREAKKKNK